MLRSIVYELKFHCNWAAQLGQTEGAVASGQSEGGVRHCATACCARRPLSCGWADALPRRRRAKFVALIARGRAASAAARARSRATAQHHRMAGLALQQPPSRLLAQRQCWIGLPAAAAAQGGAAAKGVHHRRPEPHLQCVGGRGVGGRQAGEGRRDRCAAVRAAWACAAVVPAPLTPFFLLHLPLPTRSGPQVARSV